MTYKKLSECQYCKESFEDKSTSQRANHTRWCNLNPKSEEYRQNNTGILAMHSKESVSKRTIGIKEAHKEGKYDHLDRSYNKGKKLSEQARLNQSIGARNSKHRRLVRSVRPYITKTGERVLLDSSWEEVLAKRLDYLDIEWERPKIPIPYQDKEGKQRNYFPDFYLKDYDLYLDPKNPYVLKVQKHKIDCVMRTISNLRIIEDISGCENFTP